ncbi:MAG: T9SS type A sorting domain-containing protein [Bacteroidia bacterium]
MKYLPSSLCAVFFLALLSEGAAQITLTLADFPSSAISVTLLTDTSDGQMGISPGAGGANQVWDFSSYNTGNTRTQTVDYGVNVPNSDYPAANSTPCQNNNGAEICSYFRMEPNGLYHEGATIDMNLPLPAVLRMSVKYIPAAKEYSFPFSFGSLDSISFMGQQLTVSNPPQNGNDSLFAKQYRTRKMEADGWGTLISPIGGTSYNSLRIKVTETSYDTSWSHSPGAGWTLNSIEPLFTSISYIWVANGQWGPIAKLMAGNMTTSSWRYTFYQSSLASAVLPNYEAAPFKLYPNPAQDVLTLQLDEMPFDGIAKIFDSSGRLLRTISLMELQTKIDIADLPAGLYLLGLAQAHAYRSMRFVKH